MSLAEGGPVQGMTGASAEAMNYLNQMSPDQQNGGASAEAMRYLMGQTDMSPARVAQQQMAQQMATPQTSLAPTPVGTDRRFMYDQGTHSVINNPNYIDPQIERDRLAALAASSQQQFFAQGGIASLAQGGMKAGGFVVSADAVSMAGEGNTDAGYERIAKAIPGAVPIRGKDGGQADTVATSIEGKQPARIAHGEMYVPPAAVAGLAGKGTPPAKRREAGAKKLYAMMDNVRKQATGSKRQIKPVDLRKALA